MEYTKLLRIEYNNKVFDVFCDANHRKTFLEVKIIDNIEKYYHPEIKDLINLNKMYNTTKQDLYSRKYTFKERIIISGFLMQLSALTINSFNLDDFNNKLDQHLNVVFDRVLSTSNNQVVIHKISELDKYGYDKVSFEEVRETLRNNSNIDDKHREYINKFIDALEERLPEADLRVFNINLKTLTFKIYSDEEFSQEFEEITMGCYKSGTNVIVLREKYATEYMEESVLFHELVHSMVYSSFVGENSLLHKSYDINGYGTSANDSLTEITAQYLLSDNWETYFDAPDHNYTGYEYMTDIYYPIFDLTNYTIYDFLNGDVTDLQTRLEAYDLAYAIDVLDVVMNGETNAMIRENRESINKMLESIVQAQLNKNLGLNSIIINFNNNNYVYQIDAITKETVVNEDGTSSERIIEETIEKKDIHLVRIHDGENIYDIPDDALRVYPVLTNGVITYRFAKAKEVIITPKDDSNTYYGARTIYEDLITKEALTEETEFFSLDSFIQSQTGINPSIYRCTIELDISILNNQKFINEYNNKINIEKFMEKEEQKRMMR